MYRWFKRLIGQDPDRYNECPLRERKEAYSYAAPLPTCNIQGCYEEYWSPPPGKGVYPYCRRHFNMLRNGIDIRRICSHPSCDVEIIGSPKERCVDHASRLIT